jgi:hypothetical protein
MKTKNIFGVILISILFLIACGKKEINTTKTDINSNQDTTVTFETKNYSRSVNNCSPDSEGCSYIKITYEVMKSGKIKDIFNRTILDSLIKYTAMGSDTIKTIEALFNDFIAQVNEAKKENPEYFNPWAIESVGKVENQNQKVICYTIDNYYNTGGAHPNIFLLYLNFNRETGNVFELKDLFKPGYEKKLNKLVDKQFRKDNKLKTNDDLTQKGDINLFENKIEFNNNFAIEKDGLTFFYNRYEIAAYVFGPIVVTIPYKDLKEIISNTGPLGK